MARPTVSKWEQGLSAPDADMITSLSETLEVPVNALLQDNCLDVFADRMQVLLEELELIQMQVVRRSMTRKRIFFWLCIGLGAIIIANSAFCLRLRVLFGWDYSDPEAAVLGAAFHSLEWLFVRMAPLL